MALVSAEVQRTLKDTIATDGEPKCRAKLCFLQRFVLPLHDASVLTKSSDELQHVLASVRLTVLWLPAALPLQTGAQAESLAADLG